MRQNNHPMQPLILMLYGFRAKQSVHQTLSNTKKVDAQASTAKKCIVK
jgi:hypothetical protein